MDERISLLFRLLQLKRIFDLPPPSLRAKIFEAKEGGRKKVQLLAIPNVTTLPQKRRREMS